MKGAGDSGFFAAILLLHERRGLRYPIRAWHHDIQWAMNRYIDDPGALQCVPMSIHHHVYMSNVADVADYNEIAVNVSGGSLADIGTKHSLWDELCAARPQAPDRTDYERAEADRVLAGIDGPFIVAQLSGWSYRNEKSVPEVLVPEYAAAIADATGAWVLVDDHYEGTPQEVGRCSHPKVRYIAGQNDRIGFPVKFEIMSRSNLIVGIDSAYIHIGRLAWGVPRLCLWMSRHSFAGRYHLPTPGTTNLYPSGYRDWYDRLPSDFNCEPVGHWTIPARDVAEWAAKVIR